MDRGTDRTRDDLHLRGRDVSRAAVQAHPGNPGGPVLGVEGMTAPSAIRVAYADPPYLGQGDRYDHPQSGEWNRLSTHLALIERLCDQFPEGWAMSLPSTNL